MVCGECTHAWTHRDVLLSQHSFLEIVSTKKKNIKGMEDCVEGRRDSNAAFWRSVSSSRLQSVLHTEHLLQEWTREWAEEEQDRTADGYELGEEEEPGEEGEDIGQLFSTHHMEN